MVRLPDVSSPAAVQQLAGDYFAKGETMEQSLIFDGRRPIVATAGPSRVHVFARQFYELQRLVMETGHREPWGKALFKGDANATFELLGIPPEQRGTEDGWKLYYGGSGSDFIRRSLEAVCFEKGTVLLDNDEFSKVAERELADIGRLVPQNVMRFQAGEGLTVGSEHFEQIVEGMRSGVVTTVYFTLNATTTGVNQKEALEALVKLRDEEDMDVVIVADGVSAQWYAAKWKNLPDVLFTSFQKDAAIGAGESVCVSNGRARKRSEQVKKAGLPTGGKLGVTANNPIDAPAQTPNMWSIFMHRIVAEAMLQGRRGEVAAMQNGALASLTEALSPGGSLNDLGFRFLVQDPQLRTKTSHVITLPDGISSGPFIKALAQKGLVVSTGYNVKGVSDEENPKYLQVRLCTYSASPMDIGDFFVGAAEEVVRELRK